MQKNLFGQSIEALVACFLQEHNLSLIEKNFHCRLGEVDLIMRDDATQALVFVEVRFRAQAFHGNPTESVDWKKQRKLKRTVLRYLQKLGDAKQVARIDVVGVSYLAEAEQTSSAHLNTDLAGCDGISTHPYKQYQLVWTRNAVTD